MAKGEAGEEGQRRIPVEAGLGGRDAAGVGVDLAPLAEANERAVDRKAVAIPLQAGQPPHLHRRSVPEAAIAAKAIGEGVEKRTPPGLRVLRELSERER